jgi:hypothetical protein
MCARVPRTPPYRELSEALEFDEAKAWLSRIAGATARAVKPETGKAALESSWI